MKKYLALSLLCLCTIAFAQKGPELGQKAQRDCNAPEIIGCGPCHKLCEQQNNEQNRQDLSDKSKQATGSQAAKAKKQ